MKTAARANLPASLESRYLLKLQSDHRLLKTKRDTMAVHQFQSLGAFVKACKKGDVPEDLVSPGYVAQAAGVTRQSVHQAIGDGRVDAWKIKGGYVFLRVDAVKEFR